MLRVGVVRVRLLLLAAIVALAGAGWPRAVSQSMTALPSAESPRTVEAATLVAGLPLNLASPLEPGLRVVALAASDIDDDGDLDLVASDGSLDLLVWLNDGAGHMTRRYGHQSGGWRHDPADASNDVAHTPVSAIAATSSCVGPDCARTLSPNDDSESHTAFEHSDRATLIAATQSPRGPPLVRLSA